MKNLRISIMQPYFFPYIGYFHLIEASDKIIFGDHVHYINRGWINRNRILVNGQPLLFTIPLDNASPNKLIKDTYIHPIEYERWKKKFLTTLTQSYSKAPFFKSSFDIVKKVLDPDISSISDLAIHSIVSVYQYLGIKISYEKQPENNTLFYEPDKSDRIIQITKLKGYTKYINTIGGQELYSKEYFKSAGIDLNFVKSKEIKYKQFNNEFVPWLSIIDILMFNDIETIIKYLSEYEII